MLGLDVTIFLLLLLVVVVVVLKGKIKTGSKGKFWQ
jgi:hypothetical protein